MITSQIYEYQLKKLILKKINEYNRTSANSEFRNKIILDFSINICYTSNVDIKEYYDDRTTSYNYDECISNQSQIFKLLKEYYEYTR